MAVLNPLDNQIVTLSASRPASYLSGCRLTTSRERLHPTQTNGQATEDPQNESQTASTASDDEDSSYFEQFLKSTTASSSGFTTTIPTTTLSDNWDGGFESISLDNETDIFNATDFAPVLSNNDGLHNGNRLENDTNFQADVEELFGESSTERSNVRVRRSNPLWSRENTGTIIVTCNNAGGFTSVRERWWYIAIANCGSYKGIDIKYRFRMTNGPPGDFWHEHFSADEMCE